MLSGLIEAAGRTHYEYVEPELRHNRAAQYADWQRDGSYWSDHLELVPIDLIDRLMWNNGRADALRTKMRAGVSLDPVRLCHTKEGRYNVSDGNHRIGVSAEMGYTHVPAVVSRELTAEPPHPGATSLKAEESGRELFHLVEALRTALRRPDVTVQWDRATPAEYYCTVERDDGAKAQVGVMRGDSLRTVYVQVDGETLARERYGGFDAELMAKGVVEKLNKFFSAGT